MWLIFQQLLDLQEESAAVHLEQHQPIAEQNRDAGEKRLQVAGPRLSEHGDSCSLVPTQLWGISCRQRKQPL